MDPNLEPEDIFATEDISQPLVTPQITPEAYQAATTQPVYEAPRASGGLSRTWRIVALVGIGVVGLGVIVGLIWLVMTLGSNTPNETPTETPVTNEVVNVPVEQPIETPVEVPVEQPTEQPAVSGDLADSDFDGLSDAEERDYNTNPLKRDTDADGLSDREEVRVYTTDPRNPDTDGDTYNDGTEVTNFYDPLDSDSTKRLFDL